MRLGDDKAAERPARAQRPGPALGDCRRRVPGERGRDRVVHREQERIRGVTASELLEYRYALGEGKRATAELGRCEQPAQAGVPGRLERRPWQPGLAFPARHVRAHHVVDMAAGEGDRVGDGHPRSLRPRP